jgi:hypothetical protein
LAEVNKKFVSSPSSSTMKIDLSLPLAIVALMMYFVVVQASQESVFANPECLGPSVSSRDWALVDSNNNCSQVTLSWTSAKYYAYSLYACNATGVNSYLLSHQSDTTCMTAGSEGAINNLNTTCGPTAAKKREGQASSAFDYFYSSIFVCDGTYISPPWVQVQSYCGMGDNYWISTWRNLANTCLPVYNTTNTNEVTHWVKQGIVCTESSTGNTFNFFSDDQCTVAAETVVLDTGCYNNLVSLECGTTLLNEPEIAPTTGAPQTETPPTTGTPPTGSVPSETPAPSANGNIISFGASMIAAVIAIATLL